MSEENEYPQQLSLFGDQADGSTIADDDRPLPLIVAQKWNFSLQHNITENGTYYYALQDWVAGITGTSGNALRQIMKRIMSDSSVSLNDTVVSDSSVSLKTAVEFPYTVANGKTYQVPYVQDEDLYRVAAYIRATKKRPALKTIKDYLAKAGVFADQARRDPEHAAARLQGTISRKAFMAALKNAVVDMPKWLPGIATDDVYKGLFNRTTEALQKDLNSKNIREDMSVPALRYLDICEWGCAQKLGNAQELTTDQAREIVQLVASIIGVQVTDFETQLGIDIVTGKKPVGPGAYDTGALRS